MAVYFREISVNDLEESEIKKLVFTSLYGFLNTIRGDFYTYFSRLSSLTTFSTWWVCGNISIG